MLKIFQYGTILDYKAPRSLISLMFLPNRKRKLLNLEKVIEARVKGQDEALQIVKEMIK